MKILKEMMILFVVLVFTLVTFVVCTIMTTQLACAKGSTYPSVSKHVNEFMMFPVFEAPQKAKEVHAQDAISVPTTTVKVELNDNNDALVNQLTALLNKLQELLKQLQVKNGV